MHFTKKIKHILLLVFLAITLASCEKECYEAGDFGKKTVKLISTDTGAMGTYSEIDGGQIRSWMDTGLKSNGDPFVINISGGWSATNGNMNDISISKVNSCSICYKKKGAVANSVNTDYNNHCGCGPKLNDSQLNSLGKLLWDEPGNESQMINGQTTGATTCATGISGNYCTCKLIPENDKTKIFSNEWFLYPLKTFSKTDPDTQSGRLEPQNQDSDYRNEPCAFKMGVGAYISLWGKDGNVTPKKAYHLASVDSFCPVNLGTVTADGYPCSILVSDQKKDMTKVTFRSKDNKIFVKCYGSGPDYTEEQQNSSDCKIKEEASYATPYYHKPGEVVKLTIYDQYYGDNSGSYDVEFLGGIQSATPDGIIASIVKEMDGYLFGSRIYDTKTQSFVVKEGVVQFMYKKIINDNVAKNVILISLILYVSFFGLAFFMGLVDYGKKEIMMRLLKIGLVIAFTSPKSWSFYNTFVVELFKNGMDSLVNVITDIFQSNMQPAVFNSVQSANGVARKFIYIDDVILTLISNSTISKIFGLLFIQGKELFAIIYIPAIFYLIYFFISTMLDVSLKYLINLFKIAIGLALGPVFILFSLFEKTKDMFNNWLAFVGARSLEIVILFTMLHPFLTMIDLTFKEMLAFRVCGVEKHNSLMGTYNVNKSELDRSLFAWIEYFLKIGSLIFITKSVCNQAGYISGQLISIGGVANADSSSGVGKGEKGFQFASAIAKGIKSMAGEAIGSKFGGQRIAHAGRMVLKGLTKLGRTEIGRNGSINDMVNNTFKYFGIRNRGVRSLLRDRQIDSALSSASASADRQGLRGEDRDTFIRGEAMSALNLFASNNKNKALALGLDNHNIEKRFEQKLVKEPLKNFIAEKAKKLKEQGIFGKDARVKIDEAVADWGKGREDDFRNKKAQELKKEGIVGEELNQKLEMAVQEWAKSDGFERKVSEFMKKKSIQGYIKSNAEMSASKAVAHVKDILKNSDGQSPEAQEKAENFIKAFRENAVNNRLDIKSEREDRKREGGAVTKVVTVGINGISKILQPVAVPLYFLASNAVNAIKAKPPKSLRNANKEYKLRFSKDKIAVAMGKGNRKVLGRIDNAVLGAKDHALGWIRGPFLGEGSLDRNPRKNLRKFNGKLYSMLGKQYTKEEKKLNGQTNEVARDSAVINKFEGLVDKEKIIKGYKVIDAQSGKNENFVKTRSESVLKKYFTGTYHTKKADDSNLKVAGKVAKTVGAVIVYPVVRPIEALYKKVLVRGARLIGLKEKSKTDMAIREHHRNLKIETLYSVFDENKNLVNGFIDKKKEELLFSGIVKKEAGESDDTYKQKFEEALKKKINEDNKYNTKRTEPEEKMALALKEIKKSAINQVEKEQKEILKEVKVDISELTEALRIAKKQEFDRTKKTRWTPEEDTKLRNAEKQKLKIKKANEKLQEIAKKLKNIDDLKKGETVFERLAKIDYMFGNKLIEKFANKDEGKDNLALLNKKIESLSNDDKNKLKQFLEFNLTTLSNDHENIAWQFEENQNKLIKIQPIVINSTHFDAPSKANFKDQKELAKNILNDEIDKKIEAVAQDVSDLNIRVEKARVAEAAAKAKDEADAKVAAAAAAAAAPSPPPPPAGAGAGGGAVGGAGGAGGPPPAGAGVSPPAGAGVSPPAGDGGAGGLPAGGGAVGGDQGAGVGGLKIENEGNEKIAYAISQIVALGHLSDDHKKIVRRIFAEDQSVTRENLVAKALAEIKSKN